MANITVKVNSSDVNRLLLKVEKSIGVVSINTWLRSVVDPYMRKSFASNFIKQGSPAGGKWKTLADSTQKDRTKIGIGAKSPILRRKGDKLYEEVTGTKGQTILGGYGMSWGLNLSVVYGANQTGTGKSGQDLPIRRMIGFSSVDRTFIVKSLTTWVKKNIGAL